MIFGRILSFHSPLSKELAGGCYRLFFVFESPCKYGLKPPSFREQTDSMPGLTPCGAGGIRSVTAGVGVSTAFFFESVLAKKVRTDPAPAITDPISQQHFFREYNWPRAGEFRHRTTCALAPLAWPRLPTMWQPLDYPVRATSFAWQ